MGLFTLAQRGDEEALGALYRKHIPLVMALLRRFPYSEDAFQCGAMGLVHAIRHFKESAGTQFSTYAVPVILGEIKHALYPARSWRDNKQLRRIHQARERLEQALLRTPTLHELENETGIAIPDLLLLLEKERAPLSIEEKHCLPLPDEKSMDWLDRLMLSDLLWRLPAWEKRLLYLRYAQDKTQAQAARMLQTTQPTLSRREKQMFLSLRAAWIGEP